MRSPSVFNVIQTCCCVLALTQPVHAELVSVDIQKREPFEGGKAFGTVGPYERIQGVMHFTVDPVARENQGVVDLKFAPTNKRRLVEYESDFLLVKPVDASRGNVAVLFNVANRGGLNWDGIFRSPDLTESSEEFVLKQGFTILAIGWQHDVGDRRPDQTVVRIRVPVASIDGKPIRGMVAVSFTPMNVEEWHLLANRGHIPYEVADPDAEGTKLSVRDLKGRTATILRDQWSFGVGVNRAGHKRPTISIKGGFQPGRTYEVIYQAQNPVVTGLGYAAVRDGVSAVEHGKIIELGLKPGDINRTIAVGLSQSGRFLRGFRQWIAG